MRDLDTVRRIWKLAPTILCVVLLSDSFSAVAATFTVTTYGEESDAFPGDGVAEIQPGTQIATLHAAIEEANAFPGPDTIVFDLSPNVHCECMGGGPCRRVLEFTTPLPPLNDPTGGTTIDGLGVNWWSGRNQDATLGDPAYDAAFVILSANNIVRNFTLWNFPQDGIVISGAEASGNVVEHMRVGGSQGPCPGTNGVDRYGVLVERGAAANVITGNSVFDAGAYGIALLGEGTENNVIVSNSLGQYAISGEEVCNVHVDEITEPTQIHVQENMMLPDFCEREDLENFLADYLGDTYKPNTLGDIYVAEGASFNTIGGGAVDEANFIGGGVWTRAYTLGEYKLRQANTYCASPGQTPLPKRGDDHGIVLDGSATMGNRIIGNYIGYRNQAVFEMPPGSNDTYIMYPARDMSGNSGNAIVVRNGASDNVIGDDEDPTLGNLIRYSYRDAVVIEGGETNRNAIYNNAIGSEENGITIEGGPKDTSVGAIGAGNVVWTREYGVEISGSGTQRTRVEGNDIYFSGFSGLAVHGAASDSLIGGTAAGAGNLFRESCSDGVIFFDTGTMANQLIGNEIYDNGEIGVFIVNGASNNIIGGSESGAGNAIYNNAVTGVEIHDVSSTGNQILGNDIHRNGTRGVFLVDGTSGNIIGGTESPERNRIYENGSYGIEVNGAATVENQIRINSIYDNAEKGIFLSFGSNREIQPPSIERFVPFTGTAAPDSFVDVFSDEAEEGRNYIDSIPVDDTGSFSRVLNLTPYRNSNLTATTTDLDGNTSEFSLPVAIIPPSFTEVPNDRVIVEGDNFTLSVAVEGSPEITYRWRFRTADGNYSDLENGVTFGGVDTTTLSVSNGQPPQEGFYQCVADNGLGAVNARAIFVRVVPEDLNELQVNTLSDASDGNTSSFGRLLASPGDDGLVSLREALAAANTMPGANTIRFAVEGTIAVESALPAIGDATGGLTLDGGEVLSLDGSALTGGASGLTLTSADNHIAGFGIYHFPGHGIVLTGAGASDNTIVTCTVGTDGETVMANGADGIVLRNGASGNTIGGAGDGDGNLVGGHPNTGITLLGVGTASNLIQGNTVTGNALAGVYLTEGAADNTVGGDTADAGNTIAENTGIGVYVAGANTVRNTIRNNRISGNGDLGIRLFEGGNEGLAQPVITSVEPVAGTAPANSLVDFFLAADEEGETLLFSLTADGEGRFSTAMDLSEHDGHHLTATATSAAGNTSAFSAPANIDFTAPALSLNGSATVMLECGVAWDDPGAAATDNLDGDLTGAVLATLLDGAGNPAGPVAEAPPGSYTLRYTVSDASGLAAAPVTRAVTIADSAAPEVTLNGDADVELGCGEAWDDPGATALDACAGALEVSVSGEVNLARAGEYTLTYTATDGAGNTAAGVSRTVTVLDTAAPVVTLMGESMLTLECGRPYEEPGSTALDACEGEVAVMRTGTVDSGRTGLYVLSYNAIDTAGNRAVTVTRSVVVEDDTAPVLALNGDAEVTITCGQGYAEQGATLMDVCDAGADVAVSGDFNPNAAGVYTLFYDATDASGNVAETVTRTVTVLGGSAPSIAITGDAAVSVPCNTAYQDAGARAVDGCQTDITERIEVDNPVDPSQPGTYTVTYTVEDGAGVAAEPATRTVTVLPCVASCDDECSGDPDDLVDEDGDGLSACKESCLGTSDRNPDSDGDGMPDGFEYEHRLNPLADDGAQDADLDGTSNTDEFLEMGLPRDEDSPYRTFFVSPSGSNLPGAGTRENPWQTVAYAMNRVQPGAEAPVRIFLEAGVYVEDVTVKGHAELRNASGADVEIMGAAVLRADAVVRGITFTSDAADTGILFLEGSATVRDCTVNGEFGVNLAGIVVEPDSAPGSVVEGCLLRNLATGIDVSGALPAVRQCAFANIAGVAVLLRSGATIAAADSQMGLGLNGWNDFSGLGEGLAIMNQTGAALSAQWNDWGTDSVSEQQALVEGVVNQGNALAAGGASMASALEVVVSDGADQDRVAGAQVTITGGSGSMNATTDSDGRAGFPALPAGTWQVAVTASGFPDASASASLEAGARRVVNVVLQKDDTQPQPTDPVACAGTSGPGNPGSNLVLIGLLIACLMAGRLRKATGRNPKGNGPEF